VLIDSYAKINLFLDVICKRDDGYHEIDTIFSTIDLHDTLKFVLTKKPGIKILSNIPELASETNLVYKIANRIVADFEVKAGLRVNLFKRIPVASGLGGGSSNAAMTILALKRLLKLNISNEYMSKIASEYGSDIYFFLFGGRARGKSRGEAITLLPDVKQVNLLLVNPGITISSKEAYDLIEWSSETPKYRLWYNRLESGIELKYPIISYLKADLKKNGAKKAMMSGSGATCIGKFTDDRQLREAYYMYRQKGIWCKVVQLIGRSQYKRCIQNLS